MSLSPLQRKLTTWAQHDTTLQKNITFTSKENRVVIHIQKALWRRLEPLFNRNKKLYASREVKETALASEGQLSCRPETKNTVNRCVPWPLSVKQAAKRLVWDVKGFLKGRKNVMFLNKIDVPYCLVVFFVVCPRLRPFWSVFGELALFWCSTAKRKTRQNSDFRSVRRSRRIIPLENYPRPQFLQKFKAEMLQFHVHSLDSQFLPQIVH